ncbi:hypothetical protein TREMEDRAFT_65716 [Tremella mesenterica DSM 1558]|uniref:uncharacterized protein n=1 Tax=Tremella mesenterica (strain ATCC 24925 / CBS 8224 / DSM 1558 / NBRC 9311 / NRRL Y-6157 / RJB 2259-6 / UBC 559-6) TaxID=578456 RepID=UPI00032C64EC|nr:uncharacterized protein TREMEDRAFT_65716 [Tremella mesenterica DSM 1558]EIW66124.1 hypothetical protein TREMEDRAFT_65716 [Tremella mesenterica DSM 1558]
MTLSIFDKCIFYIPPGQRYVGDVNEESHVNTLIQTHRGFLIQHDHPKVTHILVIRRNWTVADLEIVVRSEMIRGRRVLDLDWIVDCIAAGVLLGEEKDWGGHLIRPGNVSKPANLHHGIKTSSLSSDSNPSLLICTPQLPFTCGVASFSTGVKPRLPYRPKKLMSTDGSTFLPPLHSLLLQTTTSTLDRESQTRCPPDPSIKELIDSTPDTPASPQSTSTPSSAEQVSSQENKRLFVDEFGDPRKFSVHGTTFERRTLTALVQRGGGDLVDEEQADYAVFPISPREVTQSRDTPQSGDMVRGSRTKAVSHEWLEVCLEKGKLVRPTDFLLPFDRLSLGGSRQVSVPTGNEQILNSQQHEECQQTSVIVSCDSGGHLTPPATPVKSVATALHSHPLIPGIRITPTLSTLLTNLDSVKMTNVTECASVSSILSTTETSAASDNVTPSSSTSETRREDVGIFVTSSSLTHRAEHEHTSHHPAESSSSFTPLDPSKSSEKRPSRVDSPTKKFRPNAPKYPSLPTISKRRFVDLEVLTSSGDLNQDASQVTPPTCPQAMRSVSTEQDMSEESTQSTTPPVVSSEPFTPIVLPPVSLSLSRDRPMYSDVLMGQAQSQAQSHVRTGLVVAEGQSVLGLEQGRPQISFKLRDDPVDSSNRWQSKRQNDIGLKDDKEEGFRPERQNFIIPSQPRIKEGDIAIGIGLGLLPRPKSE